MKYPVILLYCSLSAICVADNSHSVQIDDVSVQDEDIFGFVGIGYDLLHGNPEGDYNLGGIDPGFKLARNIFKRTYDQNKKVTYEGREVLIPDQMDYQSVYGCSSVEVATAYSGAFSYQKKLSTNVDTSGKY